MQNGLNNPEENIQVAGFEQIDINDLHGVVKSCVSTYEYIIKENKHACYSGEDFGVGEEDQCDYAERGKSPPYSTWEIIPTLNTCGDNDGGGAPGGPTDLGSGEESGPGGGTGSGGANDSVDTGISLPSTCQTTECAEEDILANVINDKLNKSLSFAQLTYLLSNNLRATQINNFLGDLPSLAKQSFAKEAIEAFDQDGEADFEEQIAVFLTGKAKLVYQKLKSTNGNLFQRTLGVFDNNDDYCLTIKYGECDTDGEGCTDGTNINLGVINIKIEDVQNSSLDLAATILHEGIHAELYKYVYEHDTGIDPSNRQDLLYYYFHYKSFGDPRFANARAQHQYMADHYIEPVAKAIRELDNNRYPLEYYLGFAWDGLRKYGWDGYWDNGVWTTLERTDPYQQYQDTVLRTTNFPYN